MEDAYIEEGAPYHNKITPNPGFSFESGGGTLLRCLVTMYEGYNTNSGEANEGWFNPSTGEVDIESVTGIIKILVYKRDNVEEADELDEAFEAIAVREGWVEPVIPRPTVTMNLEHCTASNSTDSIALGATYSNTLTPDSGYVFIRSGPSLGGVTYGGGDSGPSGGEEPGVADIGLTCTIVMGDENITTAAFDIATGEIEIEEVTGDITITVTTASVSS